MQETGVVTSSSWILSANATVLEAAGCSYAPPHIDSFVRPLAVHILEARHNNNNSN